jgi:4a-hydroxytetrahydrobiopterin dehydratase
MAKLTQAELDQTLIGLSGWSVRNGMLTKTYKHPSFPEAILFVNAVAHAAEILNHHPDIDIRYSDITLALTTHDQGGITAKDAELARRVEALRRKAGDSA